MNFSGQLSEILRMSRSTSLWRLPKNAATSREVVAGRPSWIDTVGTGSEIRRACDMVNLASVVMTARSEIEKAGS